MIRSNKVIQAYFPKPSSKEALNLCKRLFSYSVYGKAFLELGFAIKPYKTEELVEISNNEIYINLDNENKIKNSYAGFRYVDEYYTVVVTNRLKFYRNYFRNLFKLILLTKDLDRVTRDICNISQLEENFKIDIKLSYLASTYKEVLKKIPTSTLESDPYLSSNTQILENYDYPNSPLIKLSLSQKQLKISNYYELINLKRQIIRFENLSFLTTRRLAENNLEKIKTEQKVNLSKFLSENKFQVISNPKKEVFFSYKDYRIGVIPNTSPAYCHMYSDYDFVIFVKGGVLSHGAIVIREFGIPAISLAADFKEKESVISKLISAVNISKDKASISIRT